ncbi:hypothetical protein H2509_18305 [Stappia sp. F7233]|uniref:Porin n=1 Tax=Stappia albiluteola TaxID=2758565 RepID=A0A839AJ41_9HYPH|nr:hypothetical protein [Stappia albiluteola]MBA5779086.1 hypothetical protein [Stappia albiluteola]
MRYFGVSAILASAFIFPAQIADAADLSANPIFGNARPPVFEETAALRGSIGLRTWLSRSNFDYKLSTPTGVKFGTFEYNDVDSAAGEAFFQIEDTYYGSFLKGTVGLGGLFNGSFRERDFDLTFGDEIFDGSADGQTGSLAYASIDAGVNWGEFSGGRVKTTAFVGYQYIGETYNADGLRCNPDDAGGAFCLNVPGSVHTYQSQVEWHLFRVGLGLQADLGNGFSFDGEVAAIPVGYYHNEDSQYVNYYLGPVPNVESRGAGAYGVQAEAILNYAFNESFSVGAGARYWWLNSREVKTTVGASLSPPLSEDFEAEATSERFGLLAQAKYRF